MSLCAASAKTPTPSARASFVRYTYPIPAFQTNPFDHIDQSRKRGTLESDLLLSTFADKYLATMTPEQLTQYDLFLDENDWDIYYWATQHEPTSSTNPSVATSTASAGAVDPKDVPVTPGQENEQGIVTMRHPPKGEWAQTIGNFKPAYRPVPERWRGAEVLQLLREHVRTRSVDGEEGKGFAFMPPLKG